MTIRANCKINLGLRVVSRREDGYHELQTVMFPVRELYDTVTVEQSENLTFTQTGIAVDCPVEKNLCVRAARLMQRRYGVGNVAITLDKRVPFGAGLGGGSSDATAVIVAMNEIFNLNLTEDELIARAAEIGSDTAFFVRNTAQLCTGRGEVMSPISLPLKGLWLAVVKSVGEGVSTAEAYGGVKPAEPNVPLEQRLQLPVNQWQGVVKNDFEEHIFDNECDKKCNTCGFARETEHVYQTQWTSDADGHWHQCEFCGDQLETEPHIPGAEATEFEAQLCTECGYELTPALHQHEYLWNYDVEKHWQSCECEDVIEEAEHSWDEGTITVEPTYTDAGVKEYCCSVCGGVKTEEIPVLPPQTFLEKLNNTVEVPIWALIAAGGGVILLCILCAVIPSAIGKKKSGKYSN